MSGLDLLGDLAAALGGATRGADAVELAIWVAGAGGAVVLAISMVIVGGEEKPDSDGDSLKALGLAVIRLLADRALPAAAQDVTNPWGTRSVIGRLRQVADQRRHDADTFAIYQRKLAPRVRVAIAELLAAGVIGKLEANRLSTPTDLAEIELVGLRLIDLAEAKVGSGSS